ncbi:RTA1-domain-containing protein [Peniophora sp. CONT]|nr:RTA1-domain-containing protein [Peniophora sp. CONT]
MSQYNLTDLPPGVTIDDISPYGYVPTRAISFLFLALFGLSTAMHLVQAVYFRLWFLLPTVVLCGLGELTGWSGRLWSSYNIQEDNAFLMQITTTIISPTPLIAANFIMLGRIILRLGQSYSRLSQRWYTRIFLTCDIIALIAQGAGGGIASSADDKAGSDLGANIMLGGIIFQLVCIIIYSTLAAEFLWHYAKDRPFRAAIAYERRSQTPYRLKVMLLGMGIMTVLLLIRSIYRTAELADGWDGIIINTEWPFDIFDGAMIALAMITLNVIHPGWFLVPEEISDEAAWKIHAKSTSAETMLEYREVAAA